MEEATGARPLDLRCDLTDVAALRATVARAGEAHGPVTRLVCNAADDDRHATLDVSVEYWDRNQAINLRAYFFAAQAAIPGMRGAGGGSIVNFSSISYMMGNAGYASYTAANSGINGLTRSLAREFGASGIRVNALAPGWVLTEKQRPPLGHRGGSRGPPLAPVHPSSSGARRHRGPLPVPGLGRLRHGDGPGARRGRRRGRHGMSGRPRRGRPSAGVCARPRSLGPQRGGGAACAGAIRA